MINDKSDEVIKELLIHLLKEYQIGLEKSIRGSDFIFGCVHLLHYKCHKNKSKSWCVIYRFFWLDKKKQQ